MDASRRGAIRTRLLDWARQDPRVAGAAITGSAAGDAEDDWSDIDIFLGVAGVEPHEVLHDLSSRLYGELGALHHFDLTAGPALYRAFFLPDGALEVDVGLTPIEEFRSHGGAPFRVVFGDPRPATEAVLVDVDHLAGLIWHHVLHGRSSIERGRPWQAEHWISATRDHVLTLASQRFGQATAYAKGADSLPKPVTTPLEQALVRGLDPDELLRALRQVTRAAIAELREQAPTVVDRLEAPLLELADLQS